jgi:hypothetical protein
MSARTLSFFNSDDAAAPVSSDAAGMVDLVVVCVHFPGTLNV